jgi:PAS domain S-box-containing protein
MSPNPHISSELTGREPELREFLENAAVGLHWVGPDGHILWANKAEMDLLGYESQEYIGRHIADFHVDPAVIEDILRRLSGNETLHNYEARLRCKDGAIKHVLISSNVLWKDGKFLHTRCFTRDITDRKLAEEALRESEARYRILFEHNPLPAWVFDVESLAFLAVNDAAMRHYGYSRDEFLQMTVNAIRLEEDAAGLQGFVSSQFSTEKGVAQHRRKDGSTIHVEVVSNDIPFGGRPGRLVIANDITERKRDITERKRQETQLRQRLNELEAIYRLTNTIGRLGGMKEIYDEALEAIRLALRTDRAAILLFDDDQTLRFRAWRGLSDAFLHRVEGHPGWSSWQTRAGWSADVQESIQSDALGAAFLEEGIRAMAMVPLASHGRVLGQLCLLFDSSHPFSDEERRLLESIVGHIAFAIERTRADEEIRQLNGRLEERSRAAENLIKYAPDPVFVVNLEGKLLQANDAVSQLLGLRPDELVEQSLSRFLSAEEVQEFTMALRQVVERGVTRNAKLHPRNASGEVIPTTLNASALRDSGGRVVGAIGILRDMRAYERVVRDLQKSKTDLQGKILDLQKFEEVVVGRELKMIELESELVRIRTGLGRSS